jgi:hypothetical protein
MFQYAAFGAMVGGAVGGMVGKARQTTAVLSKTTRPNTADQKSTAKETFFEATKIPESVSSSIEKLEGMSTRPGRDVCKSLLGLMRQIYFATEFVEADNGEEIREKIKTAQTTLSRLGTARQLLDKLFTLERERHGQSDEFTIYRTNITEEMNAVISSTNNFLTKNMLNSVSLEF